MLRVGLSEADGRGGLDHADMVPTDERLRALTHRRGGPDDSWSWSQTMNYVGQLAGQVFFQVKELYRGLNPATLSGCIDVIVVQRPDGSLHCSPFHVRFGKMGVLRSREKVVDIEINGEAVGLQMKLGDNGEAFFVKETENMLEVVPSHLATSPITSMGELLMEAQLGKSAPRHREGPGPPLVPQTLGPLLGDTAGAKKRRKRRRKIRTEGVGGRREESDEDDDMFTIDMSSDEGEGDDNRGVYGDTESKLSSTYTHSATDWPKLQRPVPEEPMCVPPDRRLSISCPQQIARFPSNLSSDSCSSTPKSDSELANQSKDPQMLWTWGELPHAAQPSFLSDHPRSDLQTEPALASVTRSPLQDSGPTSMNLYLSQPGDLQPGDPHRGDPQSGEEGLPEACSGAGGDAGVFVPSSPGREALCGGRRGGSPPCFISSSPRLEHLEHLEHLEPLEHQGGSTGSPVRRTDSPSKRKEKRSQHLGSDGMYLDDITELEPEVAALYFPKSDSVCGSAPRSSEMMRPRSTDQSPQSLGSSEMDSGIDSLSEHTGDLPHVAISLCGGLTTNREITNDQFLEKAISYQQFSLNPSLIDDPNLVVKLGTKYYNWNTAAPLMLAMQVYQKPLPQASVENLMKERMPKKGGRWWFSWRGRNSESNPESEPGAGDVPEGMDRMKEESSSSDDDHSPANPSLGSGQPEPLAASGNVCYKKTLRLTSEQLASLQLKEGPNDVVFSVTTQYQGTCRCHGTIYLWRWNDKIVISDIDGTITRSDTLGHILPTLGKDWTHQDIARLYHNVSLNGYKFMYCSARAIGMADMTRGYLHWVNERGTMLPVGPVMLSPSSLFSALHREVIEKKPEKFKIECLSDIKHLFHPSTEPFYAAFGNRATDVYSYKEVGVPLNRIFTVNPKGELVQEHAKTNISSYGRLCEVVDHVFPLFSEGQGSEPPDPETFSPFTYWREEQPELADEGEDSQTLETGPGDPE
ncbi:phosphatidate phosphatase LPIN1 isoform X1 [Gadus macrocephalus]|uniref:phosphatidate phosphatase LPIN1 isoform X1 n=2 Tax=Gadus macrocephalus TaxID=80720 RepID=UPI0028CBA218|nr:phosphatidate phosphatase LPIN1 isoform X1 [Gadus macrocephalus]